MLDITKQTEKKFLDAKTTDSSSSVLNFTLPLPFFSVLNSDDFTFTSFYKILIANHLISFLSWNNKQWNS